MEFEDFTLASLLYKLCFKDTTHPYSAFRNLTSISCSLNIHGFLTHRFDDLGSDSANSGTATLPNDRIHTVAVNL
jgi:hypothetical protein